MRAGFVNSCAIGLAIALMLGAAPTARGQQDSTRRRPASTQRIPITKDRPATRAPAPPPAPAPAPARERERVNQDSINAVVAERARLDSIAAAERARQDERTRADQMRRDSITLADRERQDSIAEAEQRRQDDVAHRQSRARSDDELRRKRRYNSGFYMAIAGGSTMPMGELKTRTNNSYNMGWNVTVPFGVDFSGFPLGLRFDAAMDNLTGKPNFVDSFGTPVAAKNVAIFSGSGGLKLNIPIFRTASRIYAIGGASAHRITGYATSLVGSDSAQTLKDAKTNMGWYGGGGINFRFGRTALFVEARYINIEAKQPVGFAYEKANYIPVILGIQF
jgi:hypothetical protein